MTERNNSEMLQKMEQRKYDKKKATEIRQILNSLQVAVRHQGKEVLDLKKRVFELEQKTKKNG